jgi:hypothetical protein
MKNEIEPQDLSRWTKYNEMMMKREQVDFSNPSNCKRCGKPKGNHVTAYVLKQNPRCCPFVK